MQGMHVGLLLRRRLGGAAAVPGGHAQALDAAIHDKQATMHHVPGRHCLRNWLRCTQAMSPWLLWRDADEGVVRPLPTGQVHEQREQHMLL